MILTIFKQEFWMMEQLRVGVIGCGAIAQIMHIPYLVEHERFNLVSLCDASEPVLNAVADRYGIDKRYTDWNHLLENDHLDAVVICHAGSHRDSVIAALDASKHILVEKPLGWNLREVEEVVAHAKYSDRIVQLAYHKLYDPAFSYFKKHVDAMQDLGLIRITVLHPANELGFSPHRLRRGNGIIQEGHPDIGTWESQRNGQLRAFAGGVMSPLVDEVLGERKDDERLRLGYGIITVSLIHQVYMLFGLMGEPEKVISTDIWRDGFSIHSVIQYPNDVRCQMDWHFLSHLKDYSEEYAFYGNHDRVLLNFPSPYFRNFPSPVTIQGGDGELAWKKEVTVSHGEAFENELLAFYDNVVNNKKPISSLDDAIKHSRFSRQLIDAAP
jgi:predicted dehydrogenase